MGRGGRGLPLPRTPPTALGQFYVLGFGPSSLACPRPLIFRPPPSQNRSYDRGRHAEYRCF